MAPVANARNNLFAYAPFGSHIALVIGLTAHVLLVARRAAKALPPGTQTRAQEPLRRSYAILFSILAALSLASVTTFAVIWRADSYSSWLHRNHESITDSNWYGADKEGTLYAGSWYADVDLQDMSDKMAIHNAEGFMYTSQHFIGLLASSIFFGVEGHRRNLKPTTIAAFVLLGAIGSLGYALSLFFVTMLYTPTTIHQDDTPAHDALFVPSPSVYYAIIAPSLFVVACLPDIMLLKSDMPIASTARMGRIVVPLLLAFLPQIVPVSLGRKHTSKAAAHRSYAKAFYFLSISASFLYWVTLYTSVSTPPVHYKVWETAKAWVGLRTPVTRSERILSALHATGQRLKSVSKNPIISVTSSDVLFTTISLLAWTFTRNLDVDAILDSSILSFLVPKHEKHVAFVDDVKRLAHLEPESEPKASPSPEPVVETTTPKKRGRPAKSKAVPAPAAAPVVNGGSLRRSTRRGKSEALHRDHDSDGESAYQPNSTTQRVIAETEADGSPELDLVHGGESTALALFLTFVGGLGQLAASALGAEVTGPME